MVNFIEALQFLTILRFKKEKECCLTSSAAYFPLAGACLGIILIGLNELTSRLFAEPLVNLILVSALIILTGGLHLDGLADTADALFSGKERQEKLFIMRDPRKGVFGVLGLIIIILFKINLLSEVPANLKITAIFLMLVSSRYSLNIGINFFPYARAQGKANIFFEKKTVKNFLLASLAILILTGLTLNPASFIILFLAVVFTFLIDLLIKRVLGGLTGDSLGAVCELNEIAVIIFMIILPRLFI